MDSSLRKMVLLVSDDVDSGTLAEMESQLEKLGVQQCSRASLDGWLEDPRQDVRLLCALSDADIRRLLAHERVGEWEIAFLPLPSNRDAQASFGVPANLASALKGACSIEQASPIDLLLCNGRVVLGTIITGNVWGLHSNRMEEHFWRRLRETLSHLGSLRLEPYTITTAKGTAQDLAAMGIMVFGHHFAGTSATAISEAMLPNDGKLTALVLSPTSVMSHLWFLIKFRLLRRIALKDLPDSVGFVRTNALTISGRKHVEVTLDGERVEAGGLAIEVRNDAANVVVGRRFREIDDELGNARESMHTTHLPSIAASRMLRDRNLPLFPRAAEGDFRELFLGLRDSARTSTAFVVLMVISVLLAATGLFLSSASVIIGAMILAPLMAPVISLAMGIARTDPQLIRTSVRTLAVGVLLAIGCAATFALLTPLQTITPEMDSRMHPSLLDLLVALLSGVAGAYASAKEQLARSMAGVAIAVALAPPLAVTGIGIGWMNADMIMGASLLFLTNLIGIMLSASLAFLVLGFAPISRARNALAMSLGLLVLISIPLALSFNTLIRQNSIRSAINELAHMNPADGLLEVRDVAMRGNKPVARLIIRTRGELTEEMITRQKERIVEKLGHDIDLEFFAVHSR
ncbi:MAG: TIGR00341 family protein [Pseudomonadales bacterium]|nr:TIGR00341 family protein [Pseudomonadales bacterium]